MFNNPFFSSIIALKKTRILIRFGKKINHVLHTLTLLNVLVSNYPTLEIAQTKCERLFKKNKNDQNKAKTEFKFKPSARCLPLHLVHRNIPFVALAPDKAKKKSIVFFRIFCETNIVDVCLDSQNILDLKVVPSYDE